MVDMAGPTVGLGSLVASRQLRAVSGAAVRLPDPDQWVHLQFRRHAGCPICHVHLQSMVRRRDEIAAAGIKEVVVFHSTDDELRGQADELPFDVIGDPGKALYAEFGVESSRRALLDARAILPVLLPTLRHPPGIGSPPVNLRPTGGRLGLPADFLIDSAGRVVACKHGSHAYDQWSVDELLGLLG
jgi:peroxiredoxin